MNEEVYVSRQEAAAALGVTNRHSIVARTWADMEAEVQEGRTSGEIDVEGQPAR